ncbi:MAG TPA: hypothetical protein VF735_09500 [Pyrinomonadaceae bacterium]|jgi:hypothetical protein
MLRLNIPMGQQHFEIERTSLRVDSLNGRGDVKVLDFGLAKKTEDLYQTAEELLADLNALRRTRDWQKHGRRWITTGPAMMRFF